MTTRVVSVLYSGILAISSYQIQLDSNTTDPGSGSVARIPAIFLEDPIGFLRNSIGSNRIVPDSMEIQWKIANFLVLDSNGKLSNIDWKVSN